MEDFVRPFLARRERWQRILRRSPEHMRLEKRLEENVVKELHTAKQGRKLEKVNERHERMEVRMTCVDCDAMMLKWWKPEVAASGMISGLMDSVSKTAAGAAKTATFGVIGSDGLKTMELSDMTRLQYGHETEMHIRYPEVPPWLCFACVTEERSYQFVCPDEHVTKCFVLALSRACPDVPGAIPSRRNFLLRKAWCKVNHAAMLKGKSVVQLFVEAAKLSEALRPKPVKVPTISLKPAASSSKDVTSSFSSRGSSKDSGGMLCLQSFLASANSVSPPTRRGAWPKAGETWVFTGLVKEVDIYKDSKGEQWANQMPCMDKAARRTVTVLSAPEGCNFVEIRGTEKLKFVKGWMRFVDNSETWLLERVDGV